MGLVHQKAPGPPLERSPHANAAPDLLTARLRPSTLHPTPCARRQEGSPHILQRQLPPLSLKRRQNLLCQPAGVKSDDAFTRAPSKQERNSRRRRPKWLQPLGTRVGPGERRRPHGGGEPYSPRSDLTLIRSTLTSARPPHLMASSTAPAEAAPPLCRGSAGRVRRPWSVSVGHYRRAASEEGKGPCALQRTHACSLAAEGRPGRGLTLRGTLHAGPGGEAGLELQEGALGCRVGRVLAQYRAHLRQHTALWQLLRPAAACCSVRSGTDPIVPFS